jgi:hypothetical protein
VKNTPFYGGFVHVLSFMLDMTADVKVGRDVWNIFDNLSRQVTMIKERQGDDFNEEQMYGLNVVLPNEKKRGWFSKSPALSGKPMPGSRAPGSPESVLEEIQNLRNLITTMSKQNNELQSENETLKKKLGIPSTYKQCSLHLTFC